MVIQTRQYTLQDHIKNYSTIPSKSSYNSETIPRSSPNVDSVFELVKTYTSMILKNFAQIHVYHTGAMRLGETRALSMMNDDRTMKTKCSISHMHIKLGG